MTETITLWSKTASTNATADGAITWADTMSPDAVDNSARSMMAAIAKWREDAGGTLISTGAANEYTIATNGVIASHAAANGIIAFQADKTCSGAATTTIDGLAQKNIKRADGTATVSGDIVSGGKYYLAYDGTSYLALNIVANASMAALTDGDSWTAEVTVASATTCDILGAASNFISISGTTSVTSFGTGTNKIKFCRATAAFIITHNATTLICPNAANITTTAGATWIAISDGSSNVRIRDYQEAVSAITAGAYTGTNLTVNNLGQITAVASGSSGTAAAQSDQETATSTTTYVSPGRQQYHPSAAKCWAYVTVSGGTPTLVTSYNITSISDTAVGQLTVTIATDFSSANWCSIVTVEDGDSGEATGAIVSSTTPKAAGSVVLNSFKSTSLNDPTAWNFIGFGDQ